MCTIKADMPEVPMADPPPDFMDEQVALAQTVAHQKKRNLFAGLNETINTGAAGVLTPGRTTANA